jgi:hypothetical protein
MIRTPRLWIAILLCAGLGAWAAPQSLASLAKKDKSAKPASAQRTFTDRDLKGRSGTVSTSKVTAKGKPASTAKKQTAAPKKSRSAPASRKGASASTNQMTPVGVRGQLSGQGKR